ncbi:hypothetical protein ETAA8_58010 [Anatilimnocola aggregata]|uniref:Carboxypeptidase regulatory-like domain-containing protein n=1 Tax=Anatilimnocola aggregata TaxID=2528021 RepID=A0A517YKA1_9BACT|nr:hypothetical protein [Anatilimnocola aggregata]QDU30654.1 hypothetical protein ETAA8_58010 [Anatilimnocola aggregata]
MHNRFILAVTIVWVSALSLGCGNGVPQPEFAPLFTANGTVRRGGQLMSGGMVRFTPVADKEDFIINSLVEADGKFKLTTVRATDSRGERRPGAPAGEYTVVYEPVNVDQTVAYSPPITLPQKVTIEAKHNQLMLELPR